MKMTAIPLLLLQVCSLKQMIRPTGLFLMNFWLNVLEKVCDVKNGGLSGFIPLMDSKQHSEFLHLPL